jgi:7-cyano-7-deazaguanine reductase
VDISLREEINMLRGALPVLTYLGRDTPAPTSPDEAVIDRVPNRHPDTNYVVRFSAPEFTSLCAVTGQPDFAHFIIDYVPKAWLLESKSLKFFLTSFRNHSSFREECTIAIGKRLAAAIRPTYFRIAAYWYPRGGIPIDVFWEKGKRPTGLCLPDQGIAPFRGRG